MVITKMSQDVYDMVIISSSSFYKFYSTLQSLYCESTLVQDRERLSRKSRNFLFTICVNKYKCYVHDERYLSYTCTTNKELVKR